MFDPMDILPPVYTLDIEMRALEPVRLPAWLGSTLHGALGHALMEVACSPDCAGRHPVEPRRCTYARIFEPRRAREGTAGWIAASPAPRLTLLPPSPGVARTLEAGEPLCFSVLLLGHEAASDLDDLLRSLERMATRGLGADHGRLRLLRVASEHGDVWVEGARIGAVQARQPAPAEARHLRLSTLTPLRVLRGGEIVAPRFEDLVGAAARRVLSLASLVGGGRLEQAPGERIDIKALMREAAGHGTRIEAIWERFETRRWSRQGRRHPMHGFLGELRVEDAGSYVEWLRAASLVGVGKGTSLGFGHFQLMNPAAD